MKEDEDDLPADNVPSYTAQCLEAISAIRAFFQSSGMPENVFNAMTVLEDHALQSQILSKKKQCKTTDLFIKKEKDGCETMDKRNFFQYPIKFLLNMMHCII